MNNNIIQVSKYNLMGNNSCCTCQKPDQKNLNTLKLNSNIENLDIESEDNDSKIPNRDTIINQNFNRTEKDLKKFSHYFSLDMTPLENNKNGNIKNNFEIEEVYLNKKFSPISLISTPNKISQSINLRRYRNISMQLKYDEKESNYLNSYFKKQKLKDLNLYPFEEIKKLNKTTIRNFSNFHFMKRNGIHSSYFIKSPKENPPEFIYWKETLFKLNCGLRKNLIPKFCIAGEKQFQYYSKESKDSFSRLKPLISIPYCLIEKVVPVVFVDDHEMNEYYFEIIPFNIEKLDNKLAIESRTISSMMKSSYSINYSPKKRETFEKRLIEIVEGHLMRKISPGFTEDEVEVESPKERHLIYQGVKFQSKSTLENFLNYVKENEKKLMIAKEIKEIKERKIGKYIKTKHNWSFREIEWFLGERSYIFSVEDLSSLKKWLFILNWLISNTKKIN